MSDTGSEKMPVRPVDAATVVLIRSAAAGIEVLLTRRAEHLSFFGGFHVFPGGVVDAADRSAETLALCSGLSPQQARADLGRVGKAVQSARNSLGFWVAAVREVFEEVGVLLAYGRSDNLWRPESKAEAERFKEIRRRVRSDTAAFGEIAKGEGLRFAVDRILAFAHWVTPEMAPRRYDTRFFIAEIPEGQNPCGDGGEVAAMEWFSPAEVLEHWNADRIRMILPTQQSVEKLLPYTSAREAIAAFRDTLARTPSP